MKLSIDIDLTPAEARELFGWPDLSELHQKTLATFAEQLNDGNQDAAMALLKPYLQGSQQAFSLYQKMFENMAGKQATTKD
ncbi:hypothetical protein [Salinimonas lutimaris]|uniref:hypothetical protein n=1 Tax=Salinimonas lutimaris TaxID=914153 RepID=UPI0010C1266C|nr:hypothetical protein [Salinimonas lutimaris]